MNSGRQITGVNHVRGIHQEGRDVNLGIQEYWNLLAPCANRVVLEVCITIHY